MPGSGSAAGFAVLEEHFPELGTGGQSGTIVFKARQGVDDPAVRAAMEELFAHGRRRLPRRATVSRSTRAPPSSRRTPRGPGQIARDGPLAGQLAYAQVNLSADVDDTESGLHRQGDQRATPPPSRASRCCRAASTWPWSSLRRPS